MLEEGADSLTPREWTGLQGAGGIDRVGPFINVADDAVRIDHEGDAVGKEVSEIEDTVSFGDYLFSIAQERERRAGFLGKLTVPFLAIEADPQHLCTRGLELGDITLIRLDLFRSTGRRGADVEGQYDGFLAPKVRELNDLAVLVGQREVGGAVTDLQSRRCAKQGHKKNAHSG